MIRNQGAEPSPHDKLSVDTGNMDFVRTLEGRRHKRLPIIVVVRLASPQNPPRSAEERTFTDNVGAYGACVISARSWDAGEEAELTSVKDGIAIRGSVVHCQKLEDGRFKVGVDFGRQPVEWSSYKRYDGL